MGHFKQSLEMPKKVFLIRVEHVAVSILQYLFFLPLRVTPFVAEAICYVLQGGLSPWRTYGYFVAPSVL